MPQRLADPAYLAFPFRMEREGPATARRREHIRQQIEQVLFTNPSERVFELEFGAGVRRLVFEPNRTVLWDLARQRLAASLVEALRGEVDARSIEIDVGAPDDGEDGADHNTIVIHVRYRLAAIKRTESHEFVLQGGDIG